jgi:hypothetical protein
MRKAAHPNQSSGRARKPHNLYLDASLVERAKEIAEASPHKSLSGMVEALLASHIASKKSGQIAS